MASKEQVPPQPTAQEIKKEAYLKYINSSDIVDQLAKVLTGLYEENKLPANPMEYSARFVGSPASIDPERMQIEVQRLKEQNRTLKKKLESVNLEIEEFIAKREEQ